MVGSTQKMSYFSWSEVSINIHVPMDNLDTLDPILVEGSIFLKV